MNTISKEALIEMTLIAIEEAMEEVSMDDQFSLSVIKARLGAKNIETHTVMMYFQYVQELIQKAY